MTETSKDLRPYLISAAKICENSLNAARARLTWEKMFSGLTDIFGIVRKKY